MSDIHTFQQAKLTLESDNLTYVVEAKIAERWETVSFPVYLDRETVRTLPTLKRLSATIRRKFQESSPLHQAVIWTSGTLEFTSGGEVIQFENASVVSWTIWGELDGELMEEVEMVFEGEV